jgi:hypothetical protein
MAGNLAGGLVKCLGVSRGKSPTFDCSVVSGWLSMAGTMSMRISVPQWHSGPPQLQWLRCAHRSSRRSLCLRHHMAPDITHLPATICTIPEPSRRRIRTSTSTVEKARHLHPTVVSNRQPSLSPAGSSAPCVRDPGGSPQRSRASELPRRVAEPPRSAIVPVGEDFGCGPVCY